MDLKEINSILKSVETILLFLNAILYTFSYLKGHKTKALKYFAVYLILTFCVFQGGRLILEIQRSLDLKPNNLFLSHFYFILQFAFLSLFYREFFTKKQIKNLKIASFLVAITLTMQYVYKPSIFFEFNLLEILITSVPLIIYSIIHLYNSLGKPGKYMYINAAVLTYLSLSTLIFILGNLLTTIDRQLAKNIWSLNKVFYIFYLILILIEWKKSLWKTKN